MSEDTGIKRISRVALYYQLSDIIQNKIETGYFLENDKLPSERELCNMYGVSR